MVCDAAQAKHKGDGKDYAVKVIMKDKCHKEGEMEKVQDEINIMKKGVSPGSIAIATLWMCWPVDGKGFSPRGRRIMS